MATTNSLSGTAPSGIQIVREKFVEASDSNRRPVTELYAALHLFHPNILLIGAGAETERALKQIRPTLRAPLDSWYPTELPDLPAGGFRSLIVREIECLTARQQASLSALLSEPAADVQIVSIARLPLFPLVCQGLFLEDLYYQLNVVLLESSRDGSFGW